MAKKKVKKALKVKEKTACGGREYVTRNYMEDIVRRNIESQLFSRDDACKCPRCGQDVFALAMNHLPGKYVVTDRGHIYTKLQEMETQFNADVTREVCKAIDAVNGNKRHG
jgi:competence protein ComFB